jgi:hypothetical protein
MPRPPPAASSRRIATAFLNASSASGFWPILSISSPSSAYDSASTAFDAASG